MTVLTILLAVLWMALGLVAHAVPTIAGTLIGAGVRGIAGWPCGGSCPALRDEALRRGLTDLRTTGCRSADPDRYPRSVATDAGRAGGAGFASELASCRAASTAALPLRTKFRTHFFEF